jgi:hypothetical protein
MMKLYYGKAILFLAVVAAARSIATAEIRIIPSRSDHGATYCEYAPSLLLVNIPNCIAAVDLFMEHDGTTTSVGPVPRSATGYHIYVDVGERRGRIKFKARHAGCGGFPADEGEFEFFVDGDPPVTSDFRFINIKGRNSGHGRWVQSPALARFGPVSHEAGGNAYEYILNVDELGGGSGIKNWLKSPSNSFSVNLDEGTYHFKWGVKCCCGHLSPWRQGEVSVDNTPPDVAIRRPSADAGSFFSPLTVEIQAGDRPSGIHSVRLYVDRVDMSPEAEFSGPWMRDMMNQKSASLAIREPGAHRLIVVAEDQAGNTAQATRSVTVTRSTVKKSR